MAKERRDNETRKRQREEEIAFVERAINGGTEAREELVVQYMPAIRKVVWGLSQGRRDAGDQGFMADCAAEHVAKKLEKWEHKGSFGNWVKRVVARWVLSYERKWGKQPKPTANGQVGLGESRVEFNEVDFKDLLDAIRRELETLGEPLPSVFDELLRKAEISEGPLASSIDKRLGMKKDPYYGARKTIKLVLQKHFDEYGRRSQERSARPSNPKTESQSHSAGLARPSGLVLTKRG